VRCERKQALLSLGDCCSLPIEARHVSESEMSSVELQSERSRAF
jgi:hypothetical protein